MDGKALWKGEKEASYGAEGGKRHVGDRNEEDRRKGRKGREGRTEEGKMTKDKTGDIKTMLGWVKDDEERLREKRIQ